MPVKRKILLISAPIGSGHTRSAEALREAFSQKFADAEPIVCDIFDFFPPVAGQIILRGYLKILGFFPALYQKMYGLGNESGAVLRMREYLSRYLAGRMRRFILAHNPALVVCTHATPAGLVAYLKKEGLLNAPIAAVITDYVVHRLWVYPEFDHYFVATDDMAAYLREKGIAAKKIDVTGIPLSPRFSQAVERGKLYAELGFDPAKPVILFMGGGEGLLPMDKMLRGLHDKGLLTGLNLQVIAVTGKNAAMYQKITAFAQKNALPVKPFGYADNVHELMAVSDILISKPGGLTCAEALASALPILIYRPLPGQEEANTRCLLKEGAAELVDSPEQLAEALTQIFAAGSKRLDVMRAEAQRLGKGDAAFRVADCLGRGLGNY